MVHLYISGGVTKSYKRLKQANKCTEQKYDRYIDFRSINDCQMTELHMIDKTTYRLMIYDTEMMHPQMTDRQTDDDK